RNFISYCTGEVGPPTLNCETVLYERYELTMRIKVDLDRPRTHILGYGEPTFYLNEAQQVTPHSDGRYYVEYGGLQKTFGLADWERVYEARGRFEVIGSELIQDKPVPDFAAYWAEQRSKT